MYSTVLTQVMVRESHGSQLEEPTLNAPTYVFLLRKEKKQNPSRNLAKRGGGRNLAKCGKLEGVDFFLWNLHCKLLLHEPGNQNDAELYSETMKTQASAMFDRVISFLLAERDRAVQV